jgi:hypothetical protein
MKQAIEREFICNLWLAARNAENTEKKRQDGHERGDRQDGHGPSKLPSFLRASRVNVPCRYDVGGDLAEIGRSMLRPYKGLRAEEDGFALEGFDGDEDGDGGVDTGGGEDYGDGAPMVGAGDDFFADEAGVQDGD